MRINETLVKISMSAIPIDHELALGEDVKIMVYGTVVKSEDRDLQNGEIDRIYTVKGIEAYETKQKNG